MKFHVFGRLKHGEEKSLSKKFFFAFLITTLYRFYQANKKISVIYTLIDVDYNVPLAVHASIRQIHCSKEKLFFFSLIVT